MFAVSAALVMVGVIVIVPTVPFPATTITLTLGAEVKPLPLMTASMASGTPPSACNDPVKPPEEIPIVAAVQPDVPFALTVMELMAPPEMFAVADGAAVHPVYAITTAADV